MSGKQKVAAVRCARYDQELIGKQLNLLMTAIGADTLIQPGMNVLIKPNLLSAKTPEELMQSNQKLSGAIANIFATAENYPDLKANDNFLDLQRQLKDLEEKIAFARQFYNDTVMKYNEYLQRFPSNIIANIFKYKERPYFEINEAEKAVPKVQF